jgi:heterodisulfide reductase subunit B
MPTVVSLPGLLAKDEYLERIYRKRRVDLTNLRPVSYYGCLLVRHGGRVQEEDPENPTFVDRISEVCGATVIDWSYKTKCCGGSLAVGNPEVTGGLSLDIVEQAIRAGANCIVTACPMCHMNLESQQWVGQHNKESSQEDSMSLPVFYVTELVGLSLGLPEISSCLKRHLIDPQPVLSERGKAHV